MSENSPFSAKVGAPAPSKFPPLNIPFLRASEKRAFETMIRNVSPANFVNQNFLFCSNICGRDIKRIVFHSKCLPSHVPHGLYCGKMAPVKKTF